MGAVRPHNRIRPYPRLRAPRRLSGSDAVMPTEQL
jgi:hypothetical protein